MLFPTTPVAYELLLNMVKRMYWWKLNKELSEPMPLEEFLEVDRNYLREHLEFVPTLESRPLTLDA